MLRRKWAYMMSKLIFFVLIISVYGMCSCFTEIPPNLLKDTTVDCVHIIFFHRADECPGFSLQVHGWVEAKQKDCYDRMNCSNLGKIDSTTPIVPDSIKVNSKRKEFLYKNGTVYETNEVIKGRRYNEKILYDTTIHDTLYQLKMKSFYVKDSLVERKINIDTTFSRKKIFVNKKR